MADALRHDARPNVLIIIMDDLCWGDLACHGNPHTATPHLDQLHGESTRLTRYCSGPLSTPARASLMTGRYPYRTRAIDTYLGRSMIDPDEVTLAEVLRDAGYRTGIFGKWHLGDCYPVRPIDKGFDDGLYHRGGGVGQPSDPAGSSYFDPILQRRGRDEQVKGYCTDIFADATVEFIRSHRDQPWFAYLATNAPHSPFDVPDQWADPYRAKDLPENWARLYGMVENIDHNVGKVMATLDELGLREDTIVIYTSDHGPCGSAAVEGKHRWNADLRGFKSTMYEGGMRVPHFWRWPAKLAAGRDLDTVANPIDLMPTLAAACGAALPTDRPIDGENLLPLLTGDLSPDAWRDRFTFFQWHRGDAPIRYRNYAVVSQRYKLTRPQETKRDELYDIVADPLEQHDLAGEMPDVVAQMRAAYDAWFDDCSSTRPCNYDPPRIAVGTPHESPTMLTRQDWRAIGKDDWTDTGLGYWLIDVTAHARYRITVDAPAADAPRTVGMRCGDVMRTTQLDAGATRWVIDDVPLKRGPAALEAWVDHGDEPATGVCYVFVERKA